MLDTNIFIELENTLFGVEIGIYMYCKVENVFKWVCALFQTELEFGSVGFWVKGKMGVPRNKPLRAREEPTTNLTCLWRQGWVFNLDYIGGVQVFSPLHNPLSP